jgi:pre-mRNA-splicing factor CDC5/CEF1
MEALNLRNMTVQQTPLLGDENTPLHTSADGGTGFESATPRHQTAFTPNPLATPLANGVNGAPATPRSNVSGTPLRTPVRDNLSINPDGSFGNETPRDERVRISTAKRSLQAGFMNLPRPENNFELLVPDEEEEDTDGGKVLSEEDAAERDARLKRMREDEERRAFARRSQAVQQGLPRPPNVDLDAILAELHLIPANESDLEKAQRMVDRELVQVLQHDAIAYPIPGTANTGSTASTYEIPADDLVALGKAEVQRELAGAVGFPDAPAERVKEGIFALGKQATVDESVSWATLRQQLAFDASDGTWKDPASMAVDARIAGYAALVEEARAAMHRQAAAAGKVEKKLGITLGGYLKRSADLGDQLRTSFATLSEEAIDRESYDRLRAQENAAGPSRVASLRESVDHLERRERSLQSLYSELAQEKEDAERRVAALEDRVMAEAEALNEASLAEDAGN